MAEAENKREAELRAAWQKGSRKTVSVGSLQRWITSVANVRVKDRLAAKAEEYAKLIIEEADYSQEGEIASLGEVVLMRLGVKDAHIRAPLPIRTQGGPE